MKRIYFLVPDVTTLHKIIDELRTTGMSDNHMHVLAKRDTPLEDMPEAGVSIKTDFIAAIERGAALGGTTGLLAGMVALRFAGYALAGGPLLGVIFAGATIGSLMSGLSGLAVGNSKLKQFTEAIDKGQLLLLLDIPKNQIENISQTVIRHHPNVKFEGVEPVLPPSI